MALVSVKLPSGWVPIEESIDKLKSTVELKRYEINENIVVLYFDQVRQPFVDPNLFSYVF